MRTVFTRKEVLEHSNVTDTDSYKFSHYILYKKRGVTKMFSYLESRGGEFDTCTLFGLQMFLHKYLAKGFDLKDIERGEKFAPKHGVPFNKKDWVTMYHRYNGKFPVVIRAIPEGLVIPTSNAVLTIECEDPDCFWVVNWLETQIMRLWFPSTIATTSREIKKTWKKYLDLSADSTDAEIGFKHHCFASRGVTCFEQAENGGAHLLSFFGSDTIAGVEAINHYYDCDMSGFSITATEHSTMTISGRENEEQTLIDWINETLVNAPNIPGIAKLSACVGDSYDIYNFGKMVCRDPVLTLLKNCDGTLVVRPDSGDPLEVLPKLLQIFEENLPSGEVTVNSKGYKLLPSYLRLIWGDGINRRSMKKILQMMVDIGWSVSNIAFGSGGGLLMDVNRDTQKWGLKCSYAEANGVELDVIKDPITDPGKKSKAGRLDLILENGEYKTVALVKGQTHHPLSVMNVVFDHGDITYNTTFDECRARMAL
jgi:nicotinamide phosphoribosyltransferase